MFHWPKSHQDVLYRLWLLRRLTFVCSLLPVMSLASVGAPMETLLGAFLFAALLAALHGVVFPQGWVDALSLSLATAILILIAPHWPSFFEHPLNVAILIYFLFCLIPFVFNAINAHMPRRNRLRVTQYELDVPADRGAASYLIRPDSSDGARSYGPCRPDGFIPVWLATIFPDKTNGLAYPTIQERLKSEPDYYVKILQERGFRQVSQSVLAGNDVLSLATRRSVTVTETEITPICEKRCQVTIREQGNALDLFGEMLFWLEDGNADHHREARDIAEGRPTLAIRSLPHVTLRIQLARMLRFSQPSKEV